MKKYYEEAKYNAAFDRCVDVMSQMLQKYGHNWWFDRWHYCDNENCKDIYGDMHIKNLRRQFLSKINICMSRLWKHFRKLL